MSGERMQQLAERLSPVSASLVNSRGIATSTIRRSDEEKGPAMDQAAMSRKVDPAEAAMKKTADEMAKKAASSKKKDSAKSEEEAAAKKAAAEKAAAEKAASEKAAAEKAAAKKAAAEKAATEKAAAEKAAAEKAAAENAAAEKAAAEKAAAEKAAAEKAAAAKKAAAEKAAAEKAAKAKKAAEEKAAAEAAAKAAAEATAIANMRDPIQELFLTSIRAYGSSGGLAAADAAAQDALKAELERVARQYGIEAGEDVTAFPKFEFKDEPVDSINISQ